MLLLTFLLEAYVDQKMKGMLLYLSDLSSK